LPQRDNWPGGCLLTRRGSGGGARQINAVATHLVAGVQLFFGMQAPGAVIPTHMVTGGKISLGKHRRYLTANFPGLMFDNRAF